MGESRTPARKTPSTSRKPSSTSTATGKQQTLLGFFTKASPALNSSPTPSCLKETTKSNRKPSAVTPVPSSDALEPSSSQENRGSAATVKVLSDDSPSHIIFADALSSTFPPELS